MAEEMMSSEELSSMVKTGAVENYSDRGYKTVGNKGAMDILHTTMLDRQLKLSEDYPDREKGYTNMALIPLSSSALAGKLDQDLDTGDVAVCMSCYGVKNSVRSLRYSVCPQGFFESEHDARVCQPEFLNSGPFLNTQTVTQG
jgi:hypothetical protein